METSSLRLVALLVCVIVSGVLNTPCTVTDVACGEGVCAGSTFRLSALTNGDVKSVMFALKG